CNSFCKPCWACPAASCWAFGVFFFFDPGGRRGFPDLNGRPRPFRKAADMKLPIFLFSRRGGLESVPSSFFCPPLIRDFVNTPITTSGLPHPIPARQRPTLSQPSNIRIVCAARKACPLKESQVKTV